MILGHKVLAIIPARGGSKGVPFKNIRPLGGKPLIAWTIEAAKQSKYIDRLILTSDDSTIIKVAKEYRCDVPFVRPAALAQDKTPGIDPVLHAIEQVPGYDWTVLLQPTSPLRTTEDIDGCLEACVLNREVSCVSVTEPDKSPYWMYTLDDQGKMNPLFSGITAERRQDLPQSYVLNGAVYTANTRWLMEYGSFIGPQMRSYLMPRDRSIDMDTIADFEYAEWLLLKRGEINK
ncbi:cytidylyltransferase domain-containing protein [Paenibacillus sp. GCM10027628]|uniref:acylneuraminate cytidylyltransferase family protein n=1 Tax=Paenibacillus sp. GCM10027628 TaxID=3273413 RepID=UPI0036419645